MVAGSIQPTVLMIGLIATRTGYLNSRARSVAPLARAVTTYCFFNSSSTPLRITRISAAVPDRPMMITGTGRCASRSITRPTLQAASTYSGENRPPTLAPELRTMNTISTSACRNCGVASPVRLTHRQRMVADRVLMGGGEDPDRNRHHVDEYHRRGVHGRVAPNPEDARAGMQELVRQVVAD